MCDWTKTASEISEKAKKRREPVEARSIFDLGEEEASGREEVERMGEEACGRRREPAEARRGREIKPNHSLVQIVGKKNEN